MLTKGKGLIFKKSIAAIIFFSFFLSVYLILNRFDYKWAWYKIPNYLIATDEIAVESPHTGYIREGKDSDSYVVEGENAERFSFKLKKNEITVYEGEYVQKGDALGVKKRMIPGPLLTGLWLTVKISVVSSLITFFIGIGVALARLSKNPIYSWPSIVYIEIVRGTPLLVQLFIIYFMVGSVLGIDDRFICGVIALSLFGGAYCAEVIRAGIESIDPGQMEAARSLGLNYFQSMYHIIFPQMFRRSLAALSGIFISLIKDSSLVSVMALTDLTKAGREIISTSFMVFEIWLVVALLYFLMTYSTSLIVHKIEKRLSLGEVK